MKEKGLSDIERKRRWFKWRWEFMRRSEEYIRDWDDIKKQSPQQVSEGKERGLREKYGLWPLQDPSLSFEEIFKRKNITPESLLNEFWMLNSTPPAFEEIGTRLCKVNGKICFFKDVILQKNTTTDDVILHIDFGRVNSITALKSALIEWVDMECRVRKTCLKETGKKAKLPTEEEIVYLELIDRERNPSVLSDIDYSKIIKIGDMKEKKKLTNEEIAKEIWPGTFNDKNGATPKTDGAIRNVSNYYKKYQQLVNGGYKKLSYP